MWPTPRAFDGCGGSSHRTVRVVNGVFTRISKRTGKRYGSDITSAVNVIQENLGLNPGLLNPDWVEWLMGFPTGWTNPEVENEELVLNDWGEEPGIPRVTTKKKNRRKRIMALGNAVVPAWAEAIGGVL